MATWRCPNCATVQTESSRCFLCSRSATSCSTCVRFRPSLVGGVGYCSLDRGREPLDGAEQRPCWTGPPAAAQDGLFDSAGPGEPSPDGQRLVPAPGHGERRGGLIEVTRP